MKRYTLVLAAIGVLTIISSVVLACTLLSDNEEEIPKGTLLLGHKDSYKVGVPVAYSSDELWLVRLSENEFVALYWYDAGPFSRSRGCKVQWEPEREFDSHKGVFREPCSGSLYSITGERLFGPTERGLDRLRTFIRDERVFVDITELVCENEVNWPCSLIGRE